MEMDTWSVALSRVEEMSNFVDKLFGTEKRRESTPEEFVEIDIGEYEQVLEQEPAAMYVKVADLASINDLPEIKKQIYEGNIVIINIGPLKNDKLMLERSIKELKRVCSDVRGDIVGLGEEQVIATPTGVKVDRTKLKGNRY